MDNMRKVGTIIFCSIEANHSQIAPTWNSLVLEYNNVRERSPVLETCHIYPMRIPTDQLFFAIYVRRENSEFFINWLRSIASYDSYEMQDRGKAGRARYEMSDMVPGQHRQSLQSGLRTLRYQGLYHF